MPLSTWRFCPETALLPCSQSEARWSPPDLGGSGFPGSLLKCSAHPSSATGVTGGPWGRCYPFLITGLPWSPAGWVHWTLLYQGHQTEPAGGGDGDHEIHREKLQNSAGIFRRLKMFSLYICVTDKTRISEYWAHTASTMTPFHLEAAVHPLLLKPSLSRGWHPTSHLSTLPSPWSPTWRVSSRTRTGPTQNPHCPALSISVLMVALMSPFTWCSSHDFLLFPSKACYLSSLHCFPQIQYKFLARIEILFCLLMISPGRLFNESLVHQFINYKFSLYRLYFPYLKILPKPHETYLINHYSNTIHLHCL